MNMFYFTLLNTLVAIQGPILYKVRLDLSSKSPVCWFTLTFYEAKNLKEENNFNKKKKEKEMKKNLEADKSSLFGGSFRSV